MGSLSNELLSLNKVHSSGKDASIFNTIVNAEDNIPGFAVGAKHVVVTDEEFVGVVTSTSAYRLHKYMVNPGNSVLFPRLSVTATAFSHYLITGLVVHLRSIASPTVITDGSSLGEIGVHYNHSVNKKDPETVLEFYQRGNVRSDKYTDDITLAIVTGKLLPSVITVGDAILLK